MHSVSTCVSLGNPWYILSWTSKGIGSGARYGSGHKPGAGMCLHFCETREEWASGEAQSPETIHILNKIVFCK